MSLRYAVLGLLANQPGSGYDLLKTFQTTLANVWPATQSQLYTELNRLADTGLVTVTAEGARGRKEYAITDAGRAEMRHWLTTSEPDGYRRNDVLLRVFFLGMVEPDEADRFLRQRAAAAARVRAHLVELDRTEKWGDDPLSVHGRIALEWGLRFSAMQQEWAEWAATEVKRYHDGRPPTG